MVNGQHFSGTTYQLDGTENRDPILGIIVINPTLESIRETKITSQNYDAEFGQATAGVVSVQTKSGANTMHGSAFEFFQSDKFQSRNPFTQFAPDPLTGRFLPETKKNQFGGSMGGPIAKNRWFFFGDYEGTRSKVGGSQLGDGADRRGAPRRFQRLRRGDFRSRHRRAGVAHAVCEQPDPSGPAVTAGAGRPAADSGAQRCPDARTARSTTTSRRDRRPSTRTPSTCASTDACATA